MDVGDVLIRTAPMRQYKELGRLTGKPARQISRSIASTGLVAAYEMGRLDTRSFVEATCRAMGVPTLPLEAFRGAWNTVVGDVEPMLIEVAAVLARFGRLVVASNANPMHWAEVSVRLAASGLTAPALLSFRVGARKPSLSFFRALAALDARVPQQALFVDDRGDNVESAMRFGMTGFRHREVSSTIAFLANGSGRPW